MEIPIRIRIPRCRYRIKNDNQNRNRVNIKKRILFELVWWTLLTEITDPGWRILFEYNRGL